MSAALDGRVALIVGGTGGIGRAIADEFAGAGATVCIADRRVDGSAARSYEIDVTSEASVASVVAAIEADCGPIDVLVNSAGILTESPAADMSLAQWQETIDVDLTGVFLGCRAVLPGMIERRWGRIINIASQLGIKGGRQMAHYSAAKAGVIGLTKAIALEVAEHNVLVNAIAPGPIETQMVADISDEWKVNKAAELPLGRFGQVSEVAPTALLLASDPGGNLFVGQTLGPNSGDVMP